ncbi:MAG: S41 family peptidase, partial [Rhodopirellula sp. JB044]|uniref:S41 family peptidase n=1 Tax=Rhodopirellula sp. JB044 TaxID=3342844 RepID=UPI00370BD86B
AILIDHDSASASEIVTACLQDQGRAIVGGTRSFGKGTVQNILPLEYGRSALRLTVAKYYRPSDRNIHRGKDDDEDDVWGVVPDEGLNIELDLATLRRLMTLWQEASYPSLKGIDRSMFSIVAADESPENGDETDTDETDTDETDTDETNTDVDVAKDDASEDELNEDQSDANELASEETVWSLDKPLVAVVERMLSNHDGSESVQNSDSQTDENDGENKAEDVDQKKAA